MWFRKEIQKVLRQMSPLLAAPPGALLVNGGGHACVLCGMLCRGHLLTVPDRGLLGGVEFAHGRVGKILRDGINSSGHGVLDLGE